MNGPSGSGKSRLARHYVKQHEDSIYIDLSGAPDDPGDRVAFMSAGLQIEQGDDDRLSEALAPFEMVFFEGDPGGLRDYLSATASTCRVDGRPDGEPFEVGPLAAEAATELLVDRVRRNDPEFELGEHNRDELSELIEVSEGWPLVVEQLARRLALFTAAELLEQCRSGAIAWGGAPSEESWSTELERLDEAEWAVLAAGLAMPGGFEAATLEEILDRPMLDVVSAIEKLIDQLMVRRVDRRGSKRARFMVEPTVMAAARKYEDEVGRGRDRVVAHWGSVTRDLWRAMVRDGGRDIFDLMRDQERNVVHAWELVRRRDVDLAAAIGAAIVETSRTGWPRDRQQEWSERLTELMREANDQESRVAAAYALARVRRASRHFDQIIELLTEVVDTTDGPLDLLAKLELARALHLLDRFDEAVALATEVRDSAPSDARAARADAHLGIAQHHSTLLRYDEAKGELVHALALASEMGVWELLVRARQAQISVTLAAGDFEASLVHATAILDELADDADPRRVAGAHLQICDIVIEMGDTTAAIDRVEKAEALLDDESFARLAGYCDYERAKIAILDGQPQRALRLLTEASGRFGDDQAGFLLKLIEEVARTMANPESVRPSIHDPLVELCEKHWAPLGSAAALMMIACRRVGGVARDGDEEELERLAVEAERSGMTARHATAMLLMGRAREPRGFDGHVCARLIPRMRGDRHMTIGRGGRWFQVGASEPVEIAGRKALPELLVAIADADGESLDPYALAEAGWPDERLHPETAKNRVYVAVHALRKMGLAELIRTEGGGYALAEDVMIEMEDER